MRTEKREVGDIGEGIVSAYLERHGFSVIEKNYSKPWGEIDIIAKKGGVIHFVEVKTLRGPLGIVTHETDQHRAEENVHTAKLKRIARTMQTYIAERNVGGEWCFDVAVVTLDTQGRRARVKFMEDIVL